MNNNLSRRLSALEATLRPDGPEICIWGQDDSGMILTDYQFADEVASRVNAGAPANTRFTNVHWTAS